MEKLYNKLVRDNIPEICRKNGEEPYTRVLSDEEYWEYLLKKDSEELEEVRTAETLEKRKEEIMEAADKKRQKNGGFEKRLLLEKVIKK